MDMVNGMPVGCTHSLGNLQKRNGAITGHVYLSMDAGE